MTYYPYDDRTIDNAELGARVRRWLDSCSLSLRELDDALGVTRRTIARAINDDPRHGESGMHLLMAELMLAVGQDVQALWVGNWSRMGIPVELVPLADQLKQRAARRRQEEPEPA